MEIYFATTVLGDRSRVIHGRTLAAELRALGHDVLVEASGSSFGIGFETGYTLGALSTPLYLLYHTEGADRISRMALGLRHERAALVPYGDLDDALAFVRATFG